MDKSGPVVPVLVGATVALGLAVATLAFSPTPSQAGCSDSPEPGVDWSYCDQNGLRLGGASLSGAKFISASLNTSDFRNAQLDHTDFTRAVLIRSLMGGANLTDAVMYKVEGHRANFDGATMHNTQLDKGELLRASFIGAELPNAKLSKAELGRANFQKADLTNATFSFSNLARADFRGAELTGVDFTGAYTYLTRLEGANLLVVKGIGQVQLELACGDKETQLPEKLTMPVTWPCAWAD